ncbi:MAG TPA: biotin--[acetyl-CoA-carboxylase] ligase [Candidatus Cybelea sp.]|jgi:BirA family biotin operon repressor/biotin-[acetyl-CoA-carboxylase] ligase|nr:biotin--[acetyl-CoA-carboxylase] ligase [Candidatus Cybelea sp.]
MERTAGPYESVARQLAGSPFASIEYREDTGSTNADAAELLGDSRYAGHTIVAEYQRTGTGRKGRAWEAAAGTSLLFTTILPEPLSADRLWLAPFWVALAVRRALSEFGVHALLVWPNDLLLRDRKLAGILCRSRVTGTIASVACGVGINVRRSRSLSPGDELRAYCEDAAPVQRPNLLAAILRTYETTLALLDDPARTIAQWEAAAEIPGRRYRIQLDGVNEPFDATAARLENGGALRVTRDDGASESVEMADARVLRAAGAG